MKNTNKKGDKRPNDNKNNFKKETQRLKIYVCCKPTRGAITWKVPKVKSFINVVFNESENSCTCAEFTKNAKKDSEFQCKHILAVLNCVSSGDIVEGRFIEKTKPKLDERFIITIEGQDFVKFQGYSIWVTRRESPRSMLSHFNCRLPTTVISPSARPPWFQSRENLSLI